jgi:hypothetical protein
VVRSWSSQPVGDAAWTLLCRGGPTARPAGDTGREGVQHHLRRHPGAGEVGGQQLDVLIAGDDETAKQQVSQLVSDGGFRPIDVGPLNRAQQLEQLGFLHISLQQPLALGFSSAIKFVMPTRTGLQDDRMTIS